MKNEAYKFECVVNSNITITVKAHSPEEALDVLWVTVKYPEDFVAVPL